MENRGIVPLPAFPPDPAIWSVIGNGPAAPALRVTLADDSTGIVYVRGNAGAGTLGGGVEATAIRVTVANDSTGLLAVKGNAAAGTAGGGVEANAIRVTVANDSTGLLAVKGNVASAVADSGNPVKTGSVGLNALPTAVTTGQRANAISDLFGRPLVGHIAPEMQVWKIDSETGAQAAQTVWTPDLGKKIAITSIVIGTYGTTQGRMILYFAAAGVAYSSGTTPAVFLGTFSPSASSTPGAILQPAVPIFSQVVNDSLLITTLTALSYDVTVYGYEY